MSGRSGRAGASLPSPQHDDVGGGGAAGSVLDEARPPTWTVTTQEVLALLGRKWVAAILRELLDGARRHFQLRVAVKGIQPKVLRETLRFLERDGMVERVLHDDGLGGRAIAYELTELGRTLIEPLGAVYEWGREHLDEVHARQRQHARFEDVG